MATRSTLQALPVAVLAVVLAAPVPVAGSRDPAGDICNLDFPDDYVPHDESPLDGDEVPRILEPVFIPYPCDQRSVSVRPDHEQGFAFDRTFDACLGPPAAPVECSPNVWTVSVGAYVRAFEEPDLHFANLHFVVELFDATTLQTQYVVCTIFAGAPATLPPLGCADAQICLSQSDPCWASGDTAVIEFQSSGQLDAPLLLVPPPTKGWLVVTFFASCC